MIDFPELWPQPLVPLLPTSALPESYRLLHPKESR